MSLVWWSRERERHEVLISDEVLNELSDPRYPRSDAALEFVRDVPVLAITPDMVALAQVLVDQQVMPKPVAGDALHVAIAVVREVDYMLTWNVKHLANPNKVQPLAAVCREFGLGAPHLLRPDDLLELRNESD